MLELNSPGRHQAIAPSGSRATKRLRRFVRCSDRGLLDDMEWDSRNVVLTLAMGEVSSTRTLHRAEIRREPPAVTDEHQADGDESCTPSNRENTVLIASEPRAQGFQQPDVDHIVRT